MARISLAADFRDFLKLCLQHEVEFMVVGGYAVVHYSRPRYTGGLDIWVSSTTANAERIVTVLQEFGFRGDDVTPELITSPGQIVRMGFEPMLSNSSQRLTGSNSWNAIQDARHLSHLSRPSARIRPLPTTRILRKFIQSSRRIHTAGVSPSCARSLEPPIHQMPNSASDSGWKPGFPSPICRSGVYSPIRGYREGGSFAKIGE